MAGISSKALKPKYTQNNFKYNGKELQNQEFSDGTGLEEYDYKQRFFDPQIGRFFNLDKASENYISFSPYMYGANNPLRFIDIQGFGPGDRIKKAESMEGTKYSQDRNLNQGKELRTGNSAVALEYTDCSEFVCRVMADDGITNGVQQMDTKALADFLDNDDKFIRSDSDPKPGDIFLWRGDGHGHTGIVVSYDKQTGKVITSEARGVRLGTRKATRDISDFSGSDWKGFYRPKVENPDKKSNDKTKNSNETANEKFQRLMKNAEEAIKNSDFLLEQVKKNNEEEKKQQAEDKKNQDESQFDSYDYLNLRK